MINLNNEKIKIGIVGLNFGEKIIYQQIVNGPGKDFFELAAVCDIDKDKADKKAASLGVKAYYDLDKLIADPDIPVVGLYTGPGGRANLLRKIIRAGKDVITTKPFELDPVEAKNVLEEARSMGRIIHLNSPSPLLPPDLAKINEWVQTYNLGRTIGCRMDVWCTYREKENGSWYDNPDLCPVAPVFRLGIYLINDLSRLCGEAESVYVMSSRIFTERPTPDNAQLSIRFKDGTLANIFASFCINDGQLYKNSMILNCENGTVYRNVGFSDKEQPQGVYEMSVIAYNSKEEGYVNDKAVVYGGSGDYQWDAFYRAVKGEKLTDEVSINEIVTGIKVINAMKKADKSGCIEYI